MNIIFNKEQNLFYVASVAAVFITGINFASAGVNVILTGEKEVPSVITNAIGESNIKVATDTSISGTVTTTGMEGTAAHIHEGPPGKNGPVIITLKKVSDKIWEVPPGTRLTEGQYANYKSGNLYLNVHSATYKSGEIRGQISDNRLSHNLKK